MNLPNITLPILSIYHIRSAPNIKANLKQVNEISSKLPKIEINTQMIAELKENAQDFVYDNQISYIAGFSIEEKDQSTRMIVLFTLFIILDVVFLVWFYVKVRGHQRKPEESSERQISLASI